MFPRLLAIASCLVLPMTLASSADAQTAPAASSEPSQDDDARTLFQLGQSAFDAGRYPAALDYFQQAYDLSHRPQLFYNIGQAADRLRQDRRALEAFEAFLHEAPESPQHASTRARVEVLRATIAEADARERAGSAAPTPETTAAASMADVEEPTGNPAVGWAIAGAGGGALIVGAVFLVLGVSDKNAVESAPDGSSFGAIEAEYERASTRITVGSVLMGVGAAAAATGVVLALRTGPRDDDSPTALDLRVGPNGFLLRRSF